MQVKSMGTYMRTHLLEAIALNKERLPKYARLSDGKSIRFSKKLIRYERLSIPSALVFDYIGTRFQKRGIPFIKEEFIDMSFTPEFKDTFPAGIHNEEQLILIDTTDLNKKLKVLTKQKQWETIVSTCNDFLDQLEKQPQYYCMLKHLIESLRRTAYLAPKHDKLAKEKGIKSPIKYSTLLLKSHLFLIKTCKKLDEDCAFLHHQGIPFIYQDVPPIGLDSFYDKN